MLLTALVRGYIPRRIHKDQLFPHLLLQLQFRALKLLCILLTLAFLVLVGGWIARIIALRVWTIVVALIIVLALRGLLFNIQGILICNHIAITLKWSVWLTRVKLKHFTLLLRCHLFLIRLDTKLINSFLVLAESFHFLPFSLISCLLLFSLLLYLLHFFQILLSFH